MCNLKKFSILLIVSCCPKFSCAENNNLQEHGQTIENEKLLCDESHRQNSENSAIPSSRYRRELPATQFLDSLLGERLFNTTMNFIVPGFHVMLPRHTIDGSVDHLAMQAFFGLFWAIAWISTIAIPTVVTYFQPLGIERSIQGHQAEFQSSSFDDHGFQFKWNLNKRVRDAIGLDWTSCLQKTICQAHEHPEKYGILGGTFRVIFPHVEYHDDVDDAKGKVLDENGCNDHYRCFFDVLDVLIYIKNYCYASTHHWN